LADSSDISRAIDSGYNAAERFVRGVGAVLGVDVDKPGPDEAPLEISTPGISTQTIGLAPVAHPSPVLPAPTRVIALPAPVSSPAWFVIPVRDAAGAAQYVVTDGRTGTVTPSRQAAEILLAALNHKAAA
jgi:hypothetical protein